MSSSILFVKDPQLALIRKLDTVTEETPKSNPNPYPNPNNNPNPNPTDLINVASHEHNDLMNIMSSSILFAKEL